MFLSPRWSFASASSFLRALREVCRSVNGEITARRQTGTPKRLKAGSKQAGQLWVSVNVLTPSCGVNQRRAGVPLGASSRGLRLRRASNLNSCCLIYMSEILLFLSWRSEVSRHNPDCFETLCSRLVNTLMFLSLIWNNLLPCCVSGCDSNSSSEVWTDIVQNLVGNLKMPTSAWCAVTGTRSQISRCCEGVCAWRHSAEWWEAVRDERLWTWDASVSDQ